MSRCGSLCSISSLSSVSSVALLREAHRAVVVQAALGSRVRGNPTPFSFSPLRNCTAAQAAMSEDPSVQLQD